MRRMLVSSLCVGASALLICLFSLVSVANVAGEVERLRLETLELVLEGENAGARERLTQLAAHWEGHTFLLEMISSHDDVHEVTSAIIDARVCLEMGDTDDLIRVLEQLGTALEHIRSVQSVRLSNLY